MLYPNDVWPNKETYKEHLLYLKKMNKDLSAYRIKKKMGAMSMTEKRLIACKKYIKKKLEG